MAAKQAAQPLLRAALAYVPQHGFTREAIRAAAAATPSLVAHQALFDTPPAEATRQLLALFDATGLEAAHAALPPLAISTTTLDQPSRQRQQHDVQATERAELLLAGKLLYSAPLREHLVDALASITASASPFTLPAAAMNLRAIPTPRPLVQRAWTVTDEAIRMAQWKGHLRMDWYAHRARLSNAYLLAELHLLSPQFSGDVHASVQLLRRLARPHKLLPPMKGAQQWVEWGAGGWLGIFRSLGL